MTHPIPISSTPTPTSLLFHIAFYQFVPLDAPEAVVERLRTLSAGLLGSILVAAEGINGVLAGSAAALDVFEEVIAAPSFFGGIFAQMVFKRSGCRSAPFARLKIHLKQDRKSVV